MDDFSGEVCGAKVLRTEPSEQAPRHRDGRAGGTRFIFLPGVSLGVAPYSVLFYPGRVAVTLQVDSSRISLLAPTCNR